MCDVHLCEKMMGKIVLAGPISLLVLPPEVVFHLLLCKECEDKLTELIQLSVEKPASERVM